ncbi:DUF397 domain-containing protein [Streptomyces cinereospinus]|uniref:DUF397 domain-containing protein n=1 Tax=Streptomyces cinereospinus TaxID=285561 RepID=A0ABV5N2V6_9ACTN
MTSTPRWFKSSYSSDSGGECLEAAHGQDVIHVRDSKAASGPHLTVSGEAWAAFVALPKRSAPLRGTS